MFPHLTLPHSTHSPSFIAHGAIESRTTNHRRFSLDLGLNDRVFKFLDVTGLESMERTNCSLLLPCCRGFAFDPTRPGNSAWVDSARWSDALSGSIASS